MRRRLLLPLVPAYAAVLAAKRRLAESGRVRQRTLDDDVVVSIGSVSAGGAGKTPLVLALASALRAREFEVRVLSRGYGRRSGSAVERVDPAGTADRFGDEPLLLAQKAGVPVYVGANRYAAGRLAQAEAHAHATEQAGTAADGTAGEPRAGGTVVTLLDDGFQHRALARDLDLVLLTEEDLSDSLLPAGNLREPLSTLRRADVVVLRREEAPALRQFLFALTREGDMQAIWEPAIWEIERCLQVPSRVGSPFPAQPLAFCGIARPEGFTAALLQAGCAPCATIAFPDHHRFRERDLQRLLREARGHAADGFVTTEKDAVKLSPELRSGLERIGPVLIAELTVRLCDERAAMEQMIELAPRLDRRKVRR